MSEKKSLYINGTIGNQALFGLFTLVMAGVSIYLTNHYFDSLFATDLTAGSLCDINEYFNCDHTLASPLSNIFGVPISLMGLIFSLILFCGFFVPNKEAVEGTNHFLAILNVAGCIVLLLYSIIGLGGICPGCAVYYLFSFLSFFILARNSSYRQLDLKVFGIYAVIGLAVSGASLAHVNSKLGEQDKIAKSLVTQFESLTVVGDPEKESEYRIASATKKFADAPIRITKFSDYECPGCKGLAKTLEKVAEKYKGFVNIQYSFFPLDISCNPTMERELHRNACQAAYLAACLKDKFADITHEIFARQTVLSPDWLNKTAKKYGVEKCMNAKATKEKVVEYINRGKQYKITGTPSLILNGKKITRMLPAKQMYYLLDHLIKGKKKAQ